MKFIAIIPARHGSTRFPGKPLAMLAGKPIIQHVYEQALKVMDSVVVATDDDRIYSAVESFGGRAIMTSTEHKTGTDRIFEAYTKLNEHFDVVINIQGDEPFVAESQIKSLMDCFEDKGTDIATLVKPFSSAASFEELENPNSPKVVINPNKEAIYFSRSIVPYLRGVEKEAWLKTNRYFKHLGLYAFKSDVLEQVTKLEQTPLEICESLEQLRWLENGYTIKTAETQIETIAIDTPEDLQKAIEFLQKRK